MAKLFTDNAYFKIFLVASIEVRILLVVTELLSQAFFNL